jgi:hypothetical protein
MGEFTIYFLVTHLRKVAAEILGIQFTKAEQEWNINVIQAHVQATDKGISRKNGQKQEPAAAAATTIGDGGSNKNGDGKSQNHSNFKVVKSVSRYLGFNIFSQNETSGFFFIRNQIITEIRKSTNFYKYLIFIKIFYFLISAVASDLSKAMEPPPAQKTKNSAVCSIQ